MKWALVCFQYPVKGWGREHNSYAIVYPPVIYILLFYIFLIYVHALISLLCFFVERITRTLQIILEVVPEEDCHKL